MLSQPEVLSSGGQAEISEGDLRHQMFLELDAVVRRVEDLFRSTWCDMADACINMRDGSYWREGNFTSFHSWLRSSAPCSRSWAYLAMNAREELKDISAEDLKLMPLANAQILKRLPRATRAKKTVLEAAQSHPPREFIGIAIAESPDSHLERNVRLEWAFTESQSKNIVAFFEMWRMLNTEPASESDILEELTAKWMLENQSRFEAMRNGQA